jgi:hypothetical protein
MPRMKVERLRRLIPRRFRRPAGILLVHLFLACLVVGFCSVRLLFGTRVSIPVPHFGESRLQPSSFLTLLLGIYLGLRTALVASYPARRMALPLLLATPRRLTGVYMQQLGPVFIEWAIWAISFGVLLMMTTQGAAAWEIVPLEIWRLLGPVNIGLLSGLLLAGSLALFAPDSMKAMGLAFVYVPAGSWFANLLRARIENDWIPGHWVPTELPWALGLYFGASCLVLLPGLLVLWSADWRRDRKSGFVRFLSRLVMFVIFCVAAGLLYGGFSWTCIWLGSH